MELYTPPEDGKELPQLRIKHLQVCQCNVWTRQHEYRCDIGDPGAVGNL